MTIKHKNENTFKFKKFSERIGEVDLRSSAFYRIEHVNEIPDENQSYFYQTLQKWIQLNLTDEFGEFQKHLRGVNTITLPQLLHQKDKVMETVLGKLETATTLSLQPLLELTVALAKDLREEFYAYFQKFFDRLVGLLKTQDPDQTEWTLVCLAFLFKVLKIFLCKDISVVVKQIIPLLSENNQPEHIINFSVECISFLAKSIKNKDSFLISVLEIVIHDESSVLGCGKLFYEMIRGLNGQFHSKGGEFLQSLFDALRKPEYKKYWDTLNEILVQTVGSVLDYIELQHIPVYWTIVMSSIEALLLTPAGDNIQYYLHFLGQAIEYQGGRKVIELPKIINLVVRVIDQELSPEVMLTVSKIGASLLISNNFMMPQLEASRLSKKILHINDASVFESFVVNSIGYSQFDVLILPDFLKFFERNVNKGTLEILAKIVKQRSPNTFLEVAEHDYHIKLKNPQSAENVVSRVLNYDLKSDDEGELEECLMAMQILPHLTCFDKKKVEKRLVHLVKQSLKGIDSDEDSAKNVFFLAMAASTLQSVSGCIQKSLAVEVIDSVLKKIENDTKCLPLFKVLHFFITTQVQKALDLPLFEKIHSKLQDILKSPYQEMRLIVCQVLSSFDHLEVAHIKDSDESIFTVFRRIEEINSTVQTYRDQILLLQRVEFDSAYFQDLRESPFCIDVLKFCLGFLNSRFQLLVEPTKNVFESFMLGYDVNKFWTVFKEQLITTIDQSAENTSEASDETFTSNEFINESFESFSTLKSKSNDPIAYRVKLLQVLSDSKSSIHDTKQKDVVQLFWDFYKNEYNQEDSEPAGRQKLLICHLQVLLKLNNPKCASHSAELRALYQDLLLHRNFQVQKLALDCIMQYKEESLTTYKDMLNGILNEKTFRQELVGLKLSEKVNEVHRPDVIRVLLPILYSKMSVKASKKDQEGFKNKKEVIVRFMSNLKESEISLLADIAMNKLSPVCDLIATKSLQGITTATKIDVKVGELQSMQQFLDLIKRNVAGLFSADFQRKVLHNVLAISTFTIDVESSMFKNLKQACLSSLVEFFEHFDEFPWTDNEISIVFDIFIWNSLEEFHRHSSQNVSTLMKLFVEWSKNPKYYKLLEKTDANKNYALKSIIKLLSNKSTTTSVTECVMDIVERLLTLKEDDEVIENVNYGTTLVQPFIPEVLMTLKETLSNKNVKKLNPRNLLILSRVTELVTDVESSKLLLDILFPLVLKKSMEPQPDTEAVSKLLTTISNLLKVVPSPYTYIKQLSPLFEQICEVNHRKFLVKMLNQITTQENIELKSFVNDLNAYDRRWIEQPDFERRLSAFHRLEKLLASGDFSIDLSVIFIHHCFYFLKNEKDLAVRDNSSHFLKLVCLKTIEKCGSDKKQLDFFVDKILLNLIQRRIKDEPKVRTETIQLLGELARECPKAHPILGDLHSLTNSGNREQDFFENITHLQTFRHMKGLRKFKEVAEKFQKTPNLRTLNEFLLPIAKTFLCQEEYKRKSKVIEAAIEFTATICKLLPWNDYEMVLRHYIRKFKSDTGYQKQLIKLIPAILDSFHFDLSEADGSAIPSKIFDEKMEIPEENESGNDSDDSDEDEPEEDKQVETSTKSLNAVIVLKKNVAQRVIKNLARRIIPSLLRVITEITSDAHKLNKETRRIKEKADMLKIPIALPVIKLLQKLPGKFLDDNLSQVVLKVSSFLKSSLKQVRGTARHTLKEILVTLGPSHLRVVFENLTGMLAKGFQVHVLSVTVHTLLDAMKSQLAQTDHADKLLQQVLTICVDDIFGKLSEERDVAKISQRTPEAKPSKKSFLTLNVLAAVISENCVLDLLLPFKTQLYETQSKRTVGKIQECLQRIVTGLSSNSKISEEAFMILIHGTISESIPGLLPALKKKPFKKTRQANHSLLLAEEPKRRGAAVVNKAVKTTKQTNSYVLVEFGLELLHIVLKKKKFPDESFLNPLVPMLCDSIKSSFLRVNTLAVKCVTIIWHHKLELESLKENANAIVDEVFRILHKYATNQSSKKDNHYLLVKSSFKCVIVLMRHVEYYTINENQLKSLLLYVEQDLSNFDKETMAFTLLKSILDKKLMTPEIHEVMKKVAHLSITSESDEKRAAIRPIVLNYLMEYPIGKKIDSLVKFFVAQLSYEEISGRESAVLMIGLMFKHFPQVLLRKYSGLLFLSLGTRLVNDDSPMCREKIAEIIELLIKQLDSNPKQQIFEIVVLLLKDKKLTHREMAAQLVVRFVNAEGAEFSKKTSTILPLLLQSLTLFDAAEDDDNEDVPGKFVRLKKPRLDLPEAKMETSDDVDDQQTTEDHHLIQTLSAIIKIFELDAKVLQDESYRATIDMIGFQAQTYLSHGHVWVRLRALRIVNLLITSQHADVLEKILLDKETKMDPNNEQPFLHSRFQMRSLLFDMVVQLKPDIDQEVLDGIMENVVEISKIIKNVPFAGMVNDKKDFNLMWLVRRLRYAVHSEISTAPSSTTIRKSVFIFFNSLLDIVDAKVLHQLASSLLTPMLREMVEGEHGIEELKQTAKLAADRIKSKIGLQEYDKIRLDLQSKMLRKRVDRRKDLAQEKINNPAKAATRTIAKQLKKSDSKKRKMQHIQEGIILPRKKRRVFGGGMNDTYE